MQMVKLNKDEGAALCSLFGEAEFQRTFTLDGLGIPYFDTQMAMVDYVKLDNSPEDDPEVLRRLIGKLPKEQVQALADMGKLPTLVAGNYPVTRPTRYVEIPCLDEDAFRQMKREAALATDDPQGKSVALTELKTEEARDVAIHWLNEIGKERGVRYQFGIDDLSY